MKVKLWDLILLAPGEPGPGVGLPRPGEYRRGLSSRGGAVEDLDPDREPPLAGQSLGGADDFRDELMQGDLQKLNTMATQAVRPDEETGIEPPPEEAPCGAQEDADSAIRDGDLGVDILRSQLPKAGFSFNGGVGPDRHDVVAGPGLVRGR